MNDNHRDRSHRAHARVVLGRFTDLAGDSGQRIAVAVTGPEMNRLWPQLLRAWEWLESMAASDDEAAAWLSGLLQGPTGWQVASMLSTEQREDWLRTALAAATRLRDTSGMMAHLGAIAEVCLAREDYVQAVARYEQALRFSQHDPLMRAQDFEGLATAYAAIGNYDQAEAMFAFALDAFRSQREQNDTLVTLVHRGQARLWWDQPDRARSDADTALQLIIADGTSVPSLFERVMLEAWARCGEGLAALDIANDGISTADDAGDDRNRAQARFIRAVVAAAIGRFDAAAGDLTAARDLAQAQGLDELLHDVLADLGRAYRELGRYAESRQALNRRRQLAALWGTRRRWQALTDLADTEEAAGALETAADLHKQALGLVMQDEAMVFALGKERFLADPDIVGDVPVFAKVADLHARAISRSRLATLEVRRGSRADGWRGHDAAIAEAAGDIRLRLRVLDLAGRCAFDHAEDFERALAYQNERVGLLEEMTEPRQLAQALGECADAANCLGRRDEAIARYQRVAALDREIGDYHDEARATFNIGRLYGVGGDISEALIWLRKSARIAACHGYDFGRKAALVYLAHFTRQVPPAGITQADLRLMAMGAVLDALGDALVDDQLGEITAVLQVPPEEQRGALIAVALEEYERAMELVADGKFGEAVERLHSAATGLSQGLAGGDLLITLMKLGEIARRAGDSATASEAFTDAVTIAAEIHDTAAEYQSLNALAHLLAEDIDDRTAAVETLIRLRDRAAAQGDENERLRALVGLARLRTGTAEEDLAEAHLREALNLSRALNDPATEVDVLYLWGRLHQRRDDPEQAAEALSRALFLARAHYPAAVPLLEESLENGV
jgi:tetratricopeptide (TPR) repeat protein